MSRGILLLLVLVTACSAPKPPPYTYPGCGEEPGGGSACGGSQTFTCALDTIHAKYDTCAQDSDCAAIFPPSQCGVLCPVGVNAAEAGAYRDEVANESQRFCGGPEGTRCLEGSGCEEAGQPVPRCEVGRCVLISVPFDGGCFDCGSSGTGACMDVPCGGPDAGCLDDGGASVPCGL